MPSQLQGSQTQGVKATKQSWHDMMEEYMITVDKSDGKGLGINVKKKDGLRAVVEEVVEGGLVDEWNKKHPDTKVKPGHLVVPVNRMRNNGKKGNINMSQKECGKNKVLKILLKRPEASALCKKKVSTNEQHDRPRTKVARAVKMGESILHARLAARDLIQVNANWGQTELYKAKLAAFRKHVAVLDAELQGKIEPLIDAMRVLFTQHIPASWRVFMPSIMHHLGEPKADIQQICKMHRIPVDFAQKLLPKTIAGMARNRLRLVDGAPGGGRGAWCGTAPRKQKADGPKAKTSHKCCRADRR